MNSKSKKYHEINIRLPNSEKILYFLVISVFLLIIIYLFKPNVVVPTRVKPIYREYSSTFFSDFVFFFYSILVMHSAFKPIWFIFWPVFFYTLGKKFFKKRKKIKYSLLILGFLFAYAFYAIPNHSIVPFFFVYKPTAFTVNKEFPELCKEKNVMVFAPPKIYLMQSEFALDTYLSFKDVYVHYITSPIYYICVGNGTSVNVSFDWNPNKLNCPSDIKFKVSTEKYKEIMGNPPSLFPMFVINCNYVIFPHQPTQNKKEWTDIFCFFSSFATPKCFLHLISPSTGVFLLPEKYIY